MAGWADAVALWWAGLTLWRAGLTLWRCARLLSLALRRLGSDGRCEVHRLVLGTRAEKAGWLELVCPSAATCPDDGQLWADMVRSANGNSPGVVTMTYAPLEIGVHLVLATRPTYS